MMEGHECDSINVLRRKCYIICGSLLMDYVHSSQLLWCLILCEFRIDTRVMFHVCMCEYCSTLVVAMIKYMTHIIHAMRKHGPCKHVMGKLSSFLMVSHVDTHVKISCD